MLENHIAGGYSEDDLHCIPAAVLRSDCNDDLLDFTNFLLFHPDRMMKTVDSGAVLTSFHEPLSDKLYWIYNLVDVVVKVWHLFTNSPIFDDFRLIFDFSRDRTCLRCMSASFFFCFAVVRRICLVWSLFPQFSRISFNALFSRSGVVSNPWKRSPAFLGRSMLFRPRISSPTSSPWVRTLFHRVQCPNLLTVVTRCPHSRAFSLRSRWWLCRSLLVRGQLPRLSIFSSPEFGIPTIRSISSMLRSTFQYSRRSVGSDSWPGDTIRRLPVIVEGGIPPYSITLRCGKLDRAFVHGEERDEALCGNIECVIAEI